MLTNTGSPTPPSSLNAESEDLDENDMDGWMQRARDAYQASTCYIDSNYRKRWEDSINAFNNQHPSDSKYNSASYSKRSNVYRPKTRAVIRKTEAAASAAFFSNMDIVSIEATNQGDKAEVASAEVMKELLQYRLTKSVPWYLFVQGGIQDAQTTGVACAYLYWDYQNPGGKDQDQQGRSSAEYPAQSGNPQGAVVQQDGGSSGPNVGGSSPPPRSKPKVDKPCIELIPVENLRIDMAASWMDPVGSSPYLIHLMPMYVGDVKDKMVNGDWYTIDDDTIKQAMQDRSDTTTSARQGNKQNPKNSENPVSDYQIVWVQRHIHRRNGEDWIFYTLGDLCMLSEVKLLEEEYFHGHRPYVIGKVVLETHKVFPASVPELTAGLQNETNEIANQRLDNVKFVLNKKWFIKQGRQVDVAALMRNVPGGAVMMTDPEKDVREINFPDVTGSSFEEQNRLNADFDELAGNFSAGSVTTNRTAMEAPMRTLSMLNQGANALVEYAIRTYVETFVLPVLMLLVKMEQFYETDETILAIAADKAKLMQRFGMNEVTNDLLIKDLTIKVNVGMGATDPQSKAQKFIAGVSSYVQIVKSAVPGLNTNEVGKEIFGHLGYQDGKRFLTVDNPRELQLQQGLQQALGMVQQMQKQLNDKSQEQKLDMRKMDLDYDAKLKKLQEDFAKAYLQQTGRVMEIDARKSMESGKQQMLADKQSQQGATAPGGKDKAAKPDKSMEELKLMLQTIAHAVIEIKQKMDEPKVIHRDAQGNAVAINDRPLERDANGRIIGLQ